MRVVLFSVLACLLAALPAGAQERPAGLRLNTILVIDPSRSADFDANWAILADWAQRNDFPFYTPHSQAGTQRLITSIIRTHGDIDRLQAFIAKARSSQDEALREAIAALEDIVRSHHSVVTHYDFDLSYSPPGSYVGGFHRVETCRFQSENAGAMRSALRAYRDIWARAGEKTAFHVSWIGLGGDGQGIEIRRSAKTPEQRREIDKRLARTLKDPTLARVEAQLYGLCDGLETIGWSSRPDLLIKMAQPDGKD